MPKITRKLQITVPKRLAERMRLFREASARQAERDAAFAASGLWTDGSPADRGWTRDDLYTRG
jgi:hypothetical protein